MSMPRIIPSLAAKFCRRPLVKAWYANLEVVHDRDNTSTRRRRQRCPIALEHVPESRNPSEDSTVDWRGGFLVTVGLAALAYGLTATSERGWTRPSVFGSLLVSAVIMIAFIWSEARAPSPMLPLNLFRSSTFSGANVMTLLL